MLSLYIGIAVCIYHINSEFLCLARKLNGLQIFIEGTFVCITLSVSITCL